MVRDPSMSLRRLRVDWRLRALDSNGDLHMSNKNLSSSDVAFIADAISRNLSVRRLYLARNQLDTQSATRLSQALEGNRTLVHLDVGNNDIGSDGCIAIVASLKRLSVPFACSLTSLDLSNNINLPRLDDLDGVESAPSSWVSSLCEALEVNRSLKRLHLHSNCVNDAGAVALAGALRRNSVLVQIT